MNLGDLHKVWEIKTLKRKPREEEARKILDKVAKQVQPIMRNHKWRVKVLSEFCPKNASLLGLNVGSGIHVKLRLRRANRDNDFLSFHEVLDTMLHELCHNAHGPHNASFYKLWDELRKECEDLINNGISGSGQGFDLPGKRLGGPSRKPFSSLRQAALSAAENRARRGSLLPSGPNKIGGDSSIMAALTPVQAAAMAAERRLRDNIWCGAEHLDVLDEDEGTDPLPKSLETGSCSTISKKLDRQDTKIISQKRSRESDDVILLSYTKLQKISKFVGGSSKSEPICLDEVSPLRSYEKDLSREGSTSLPSSSHNPTVNDACDMWECRICTLMNPPLAPICELCTNRKPNNDNLKKGVWSCKFCTLENDAKIEKCTACGSWRYSYGPPLSSSAPNRGT